MKKIKEVVLSFYAGDLIVIGFALLLSLINLIFFYTIPIWYVNITINFFVILFIYGLTYMDFHKKTIFWEQFHYWYLIPTVFLAYKEAGEMINYVHAGKDYDYILIQIDRFIFGCDPAKVLFHITNPVLTEILQIAYATFFFLPVIMGVDLILTSRKRELTFGVFMVVYGFFLSYIGYFLWPAIGPRFTLFSFADTAKDLPGILTANSIRDILNSGEGIPPGTLNPAQAVQRDVFPSGHTQMTLLTMYLAYKFKIRSRKFIIPDGILLIFATVYLRYHYVVDLLGGTAFMIITLITGKYIYNHWMRIRKEPEFDYNEIK